MQDFIVQFLMQLNIAQLLGIAALFWLFYRRLSEKIEKLDEKIEKLDEKFDKKIDRLEEKLTAKADRLEARMDRLEEKVEDVDRRLCRIEGSLATHGHCLFNQSQPEKRAE